MRAVLWPLSATMLVQAMVAMAVSTVPVLSPMLAETYGLKPSLVGLYSSLVFAGAIAFTLLGGVLVRRLGAVRCSQAAVVIAGSALALTALGPLAGVVAFAVATGMGYGLSTPAASHILARVTPAHRRGITFSLKQSAVPAGGLLAGLTAPIIATALGWQAALPCVGAAVAATALAIAPLRPRLDADRDPRLAVSLRAPFRAVAAVLRRPNLRALALATLAYACMQSSLFAIFPAFLVERGALDLIAAGQAFATLQCAGVIARVAFGWASDQLLPARTILAGLGFAIAGAGALAAQLAPSWPAGAVFAMAGLVGFVATGWPGIYLAEIVRIVPPEEVGTATGGTVAFSFLGIVSGPTVFSAIVAATGSYAPAFYAFSVLAACVGALLWLTARREPRALSEPEPRV
jgi:MFS family permease